MDVIGSNPRRGDLRITDDTVQFRIQRGDRTAPFMSVPRGTYELGCHIPPVADRSFARPNEHGEMVEDVWWLFSGPDEAVALQLTTREVVVWYWDVDRDCAVTSKPLDTARFEVTPPQYYKADDAQVAYRWNHGFTPQAALIREPENDTSGVTRGGERDFLPDLPGVESMVVEPDFIAIHAADGRTLLQDELAIDPNWPCYRAQLDVFRELDGGHYAIASFETFGTFTDCNALGADSHFVNAIFDWDPSRRVFVSRFRIEEVRRTLRVGSQDATDDVARDIEVDGGLLRIRRHANERSEEAEIDGCRRSSSSDDQIAEFRLITSGGADLSLGTARSSMRDRGEDCGAP